MCENISNPRKTDSKFRLCFLGAVNYVLQRKKSQRFTRGEHGTCMQHLFSDMLSLACYTKYIQKRWPEYTQERSAQQMVSGEMCKYTYKTTM